MEEEIEKFKSEVVKINQRIKEFLWNAKNWVKKKQTWQPYRRPEILGQQKKSWKNIKRKKRLW